MSYDNLLNLEFRIQEVTIDQLYEYLKSLNENEEPNTDKIILDELLDNIDNQDIILILSEYMTNRQSCTEYPFLSSPYTPEISPMSYDNLLNLEFRIQVNNFLMLEVRQIARLLSKLLGLLYLYTLVL
jgi:hypothetical protein